MVGPFKMKNSALKMSAKSGSPMQANYASPAKIDPDKDEMSDEEKMRRAVNQGKLANWNKANKNATQAEMNAEQARIWNESKDEEKEETKNETSEEE